MSTEGTDRGVKSNFQNVRSPHGSVAVTGVVKNFNTVEEFKAADKTALFNQEAQLVCDPSG